MRARQVQTLLEKHELDGILVTTYENRRYVSGFAGSDGIALITRDKAALFVDGRYTLQAEAEARGFEVIEFQAEPYTLLREYRLTDLCIEDQRLPLADYKKLKEVLGETRFHNGSWMMEELRAVKSAEEVDAIQTAAAIADQAFSHIIGQISPGVTEREIALELEFFMRSHGAEGVSFDTIVAVAERSAFPHARPTDRAAARGDSVLMDYGCKVNGYCSDMTRTVFVGDVSGEQLKIYKTVLAARQAGLDAVKSGAACVDVDAAARTVIDAAGYGANFSHSLGHGVGLNVHEAPVISPRSGKTLTAGNVVTIEPGIYAHNALGVRIEDLVVVTDGGCVNLTASPTEVIVV
jgi:Xaa-Pro aminopeptidase